MIRDGVVLAGLVVAFATLVTAHVALAVGLARRARGWRAVAALVVAPLAPWWGWREGMRARGAVWTFAAAAYLVALLLAMR